MRTIRDLLTTKRSTIWNYSNDNVITLTALLRCRLNASAIAHFGTISTVYFTIIHLTKVHYGNIIVPMEAIGHPFLGLEAEREACITFRKSLLILASSFLVGTFFNSSRFVLWFIGGSL
ncbi:MAG: hypothetical protein WBF04_04945 [Candidatus Sulfotelmatobacter sp.]